MSTVETNSTTPPPEVQAVQLLMQIGTGYMLSASLQVAVTLGIPDKLAEGPRTTADLAKIAGVNEDALYRVLRALASAGIFEEREPRQFALNLPANILRSDQRGSLYGMALWITSPFHFRVYSNAMHAVRTGRPAADETVGMPVFEYLSKNPELSEIFNNAMTDFSASVAPAILKVYDFSDIGVLVDVAGGHGRLLTSVLREYPAMKGILFDLDHVIAGALPRLKEMGLDNRCQMTSGDFFKGVPRGGDVYMLKHIIHDWNDDRATVILRNIHSALHGNQNGRVILLEAVIQPGNQPDFAKLMDLEMLVMPGGRERTADDFRALFARAGLTLTRIIPTESPLCIIEARP